MNSVERHEARYQRRKAMREERKNNRARAVGGLSRVFSYHKMMKYGKKCCNGVRWKSSTINFELHLFSITAKQRREIFERKWKPSPYKNFPLRERGKIRPISAPTIQDRQIHKTLTREVLLPLYSADMIYNNGASLPGKGLHFAYRMLKEDLHSHYREYGREGSILLLDFKKFFPSVPHRAIYERHNRVLRHPNIRAIADQIVASVHGGYGLPLGVEASQMEMVALPSPLDNYIKCQLFIRRMGHYMDDYYVLVPPYCDPEDLLKKIIAKASQIGLTVNLKKTEIRPLTKPFKYCKATFTLTEEGHVYVHGNRDSMKRDRRKFKFFNRQVESGEMKLADLYCPVQCALGYHKNYDDHYRTLKIRRLFFALFGFSAEDYENFKVEGECG